MKLHMYISFSCNINTSGDLRLIDMNKPLIKKNGNQFDTGMKFIKANWF